MVLLFPLCFEVAVEIRAVDAVVVVVLGITCVVVVVVDVVVYLLMLGGIRVEVVVVV